MERSMILGGFTVSLFLGGDCAGSVVSVNQAGGCERWALQDEPASSSHTPCSLLVMRG